MPAVNVATRILGLVAAPINNCPFAIICGDPLATLEPEKSTLEAYTVPDKPTVSESNPGIFFL